MDYYFQNYFRTFSRGLTWGVEVDQPSRAPGSYFEETVNSVEMIWEQRQSPLYLLYSGGLDSEYMLAVMKHMGIRFTPVILRIQPDINTQDYKEAVAFCNSINVSYYTIDLDFKKFVDSGEINRIANEAECCTFEMASTMWLTTQLDGTCVTGNLEPYIIYDRDTKKFAIEELEYIHSITKYWMKHDLPGTPASMCYTAEQFLAFLLEPGVKNYVSQPYSGGVRNISRRKIDVYNNQPFFKLRERDKRTGFEVVRSGEMYTHPNIQLIQKSSEKWGGQQHFDYTSFTYYMCGQLGITSQETTSQPEAR